MLTNACYTYNTKAKDGLDVITSNPSNKYWDISVCNKVVDIRVTTASVAKYKLYTKLPSP